MSKRREPLLPMVPEPNINQFMGGRVSTSKYVTVYEYLRKCFEYNLKKIKYF